MGFVLGRKPDYEIFCFCCIGVAAACAILFFLQLKIVNRIEAAVSRLR